MTADSMRPAKVRIYVLVGEHGIVAERLPIDGWADSPDRDFFGSIILRLRLCETFKTLGIAPLGALIQQTPPSTSLTA
ncbi:hypothetical protein [Rhizobium rhizogenes]|uniref:hypothetical protein n=1 Tax=Rhizobium rhizogenes TaxID=359 RepID=UPI001572A2FC|nr:hypothetical protein [Rhizobium rhizogenes]NTF65804.1 hypothetical protein [Rhizobium rhizogenes]NTG97157.1 hypothetical protein [Rhizobium rhizogenes]